MLYYHGYLPCWGLHIWQCVLRWHDCCLPCWAVHRVGCGVGTWRSHALSNGLAWMLVSYVGDLREKWRCLALRGRRLIALLGLRPTFNIVLAEKIVFSLRKNIFQSYPVRYALVLSFAQLVHRTGISGQCVVLCVWRVCCDRDLWHAKGMYHAVLRTITECYAKWGLLYGTSLSWIKSSI